jgi:hypothetical protein
MLMLYLITGSSKVITDVMINCRWMQRRLQAAGHDPRTAAFRMLFNAPPFRSRSFTYLWVLQLYMRCWQNCWLLLPVFAWFHVTFYIISNFIIIFCFHILGIKYSHIIYSRNMTTTTASTLSCWSHTSFSTKITFLTVRRNNYFNKLSTNATCFGPKSHQQAFVFIVRSH